MSDGRKLNIGLVAHDAVKPELAHWVKTHLEKLAPHALFATGTTARVLKEANPSLNIQAMKSGPLGGDQQLGGMIADGKLQMLVFFQDPMTPQPHDVDVKALIRLSTVYDVPLACNRASADFLIMSPLFNSDEHHNARPDRLDRFRSYTDRKLS
ncbi:methylglyoxal synthase [Aestuariispira insulae]|uniref:Methylglyoxal synthase n=1 Tax=Aestuariispira insulae TaxID=1461337 RepID=A0A3D9H507_9PROT|nr:methylglyoxal synthase [Aestuariispira insulae]RED44261.1 methylglyoxal synthase [Aestuariispira insulae]